MIIGIDPGTKGGLALISLNANTVIETIPLEGLKKKEVIHALKGWIELCDINSIWIEKVGYIRGDGAMGSFTFGNVFGLLEGSILTLASEKVHYVYPMMWQSFLGCLTAGNKNVSKNRAIALFPEYHAERKRGITHGIADALLIAEYGRRRFLAPGGANKEVTS